MIRVAILILIAAMLAGCRGPASSVTGEQRRETSETRTGVEFAPPVPAYPRRTVERHGEVAVTQPSQPGKPDTWPPVAQWWSVETDWWKPQDQQPPVITNEQISSSATSKPSATSDQPLGIDASGNITVQQIVDSAKKWLYWVLVFGGAGAIAIIGGALLKNWVLIGAGAALAAVAGIGLFAPWVFGVAGAAFVLAGVVWAILFIRQHKTVVAELVDGVQNVKDKLIPVDKRPEANTILAAAQGTDASVAVDEAKRAADIAAAKARRAR